MSAIMTRDRLWWLCEMSAWTGSHWFLRILFTMLPVGMSHKRLFARFGGWKRSSTHCFYTQEVSAGAIMANSCCQLLVRGSNLAYVSPSSVSSFSFLTSWVTYMFSSRMKSTSFFCKTLSKWGLFRAWLGCSPLGFQFKLAGYSFSSLCLILHLSS